MSITAVVMAGGSGSRLWPASRSMRPKQFLNLNNKTNDTMLQTTVRRLADININKTITICNEDHRFFVAEQLNQIDKLGSIILEPVGRNTAPAIALAALQANEEDLLLVLSADHVIEDVTAFNKAIADAVTLASKDMMVTFGVVPDFPHTGYGYIKKGISQEKGCLIEKFVEKPSKKLAKQYVDSDEYLWNSGMFLFKSKVYLSELKKFEPDIYNICKKCTSKDNKSDFISVEKKLFSQCPNISIDYAIMEKTDLAAVIPLDAKWSDIGSWDSLSKIEEKDTNGNTSLGDVIVHNTSNSYIRAEDKLVATVGVDNLIVISTKDAVLVSSKDNSQDVKYIVEDLKKHKREEWKLHRKVYRPWGTFDSIGNGINHQVKLISVKPGAKLSVQSHNHRAEHWVVVSGEAVVTKGEDQLILKENESVFLPQGVIHALENKGSKVLEIIEVQYGSYLGEDDIVRYEDIYGRSSK